MYRKVVQHPGLIALESTIPVDRFSEVSHEINGIFCDNEIKICSGPTCVSWLVVLDSSLSRKVNVLLKFIWRSSGSRNCLPLEKN